MIDVAMPDFWVDKNLGINGGSTLFPSVFEKWAVLHHVHASSGTMQLAPQLLEPLRCTTPVPWNRQQHISSALGMLSLD